MAIPKSLDERLWPRLAKRENGCWEWTGCLNQWGYGSMALRKGKTSLAHRVAYTLAHGAIPEGMLVLHRCDNRKCCNPAHLFLGTNAENMADMVKKGRGRARPWQHNPNAKLTLEQAQQVRELYRAGLSQQKIADQYGVSQVAISKIVLGATYRPDAKLPSTMQ